MGEFQCLLMPMPKKVQRVKVPFVLSEDGLIIKGSFKNIWIMEQISNRLKEQFKIPVQVSPIQADTWNISIIDTKTNHLDLSYSLNKEQHAEAYELFVSGDSIRIIARSYRGCLYAWFTLRQWLNPFEEQDRIEGLIVKDAPDLDYRGMHFDFKGSMPSLEYIKETIERLATMKINTLLIEYENQFPFRTLPHIHKQGGLTPESLKELLNHAKLYGMEVIPIVQCLGHVDYILIHEEYANLREQGLTSQYCPSDPKTMILFKKMVDEIIEYHQDSEYIHIGADETWALGKCDHCQTRVKEGKLVDLFLEYVSEAASYILSKNKKPIIWDDMFHLEKCIDRVIELPKGTAISSWSYYDFEKKANWVWWGGGYHASKQWFLEDPGSIPTTNWIEDLPVSEQDIVKRFWGEGEYPQYGTSAVPWVKHYLDMGYEVFGTSCARGADHTNAWFAHQEDRLKNVSFWAEFASGLHMKGVFASAWTRFYSLSPPIEPWETGWFPTSAHACLSWNKETERDKFEHMWTLHFAEGNEQVLQAIKWIDQGMNAREEMYFGVKDNYFTGAVQLLSTCKISHPSVQRYVDVLQLSAEWESIMLGLENGFKQTEWMYYYKDEKRLWDKDYMVSRSMNVVKKNMERAIDWEQRAIDLCSTFMSADESYELVNTKVYPYKVRFEVLFSMLPVE